MARERTAEDALDELNDYYKHWTRMLTTRSIELSFGIIAANWAVHGNANAVLSNGWAKSSIVIIICFFGVDLIGTCGIGELLRRCCSAAGKDRETFVARHDNPKIRPPYWPYTKSIVTVGLLLYLIKLVAPITACFCFLLSLFPE